MTNRSEYDAFGVQSSTNATANSIGYTGQRLDNETGLMALGNGERYYSPVYARFIQQDSWLGDNQMPQSLNRFSYAHNNPFRFTDPSGNIAENNRGSMANSARNYGLDPNGENSWWNITKNAAARTGYDLWDTISFGALSREEENMAAVENGEITAEQARWNTFKNAAYSGAQVGLMVATGGAGNALTTGASLGTRIVVGAGLGAAEKFGSDLLGMGFGYQKDFSSARDYATSAIFGGLFGAASPGKAATSLAKEGKLTLGTELKLLGRETKELGQSIAGRLNPANYRMLPGGLGIDGGLPLLPRYTGKRTGNVTAESVRKPVVDNLNDPAYMKARTEAEELSGQLKEVLKSTKKGEYKNGDPIFYDRDMTLAATPVRKNGNWEVVVSSNTSKNAIPDAALDIIGSRTIAQSPRIGRLEIRFPRFSNGKWRQTYNDAEQRMLRWADKESDIDVIGKPFATRDYCEGCKNAINDRLQE